MTIGVVAAMQCEADILLGDLDIAACETRCGKPVYTGKAYGKDIIALVVCGVGKVNAAIGAQMLIDIYHAHVLVNFGVAGGIRENTEITKVYQIAEAVQYDFDLSGPNGTRIGTLDEFQENFLPLAVLPDDILPARRLATGDRFNDDPDDFFSDPRLHGRGHPRHGGRRGGAGRRARGRTVLYVESRFRQIGQRLVL